jgi:hypothetical protein
MPTDTRMKPVAPNIQALQEEPTQPPAEPRYGRDELNLAEFPLALWLLVVGVNVQRWNEQASKA